MNLDKLIQNAREGDRINIPSGVHTIGGSDGYQAPEGTVLKRGVEIVGTGDSHIVLAPYREDRDVTAIYGPYGGNRLSGVEVHLPGFKPGRKFNGVYFGNTSKPHETGENYVRNVRVNDVAGDKAARREAFGISAMGEGSLIDSCKVTAARGGSYSTLIGIQSGEMRDCTAVYPTRPNDAWGKLEWWGVGTACHNPDRKECFETTFRTVRTINALVGWYNDTGNLSGLVSDCAFLECEVGAWLNFQILPTSTPRFARYWRFLDNRVQLTQAGTVCAAVSLAASNETGDPTRRGENSICDIDIAGNEIFHAPDEEILTRKRLIVAMTSSQENATSESGICNVQIRNNKVQEIPAEKSPFAIRNRGGLAKNVTGSMSVPLQWTLN